VQKNVLDVPVVSAIYPETSAIPENVLKFYIQFSQPMREGDFLKHIRLVNSKGDNLKGVFFDNLYELWSPSHKQLTLIVDPGRVKTGLREHTKKGRAFKVGETYKLIIDTTWKSIKGKKLKEAFIKKFTVITEDTVAPNAEKISVSSIKINSKKSIIIQFNEALDVFQLKDYVRILQNDLIVNGTFKILDFGKQLQFTPETNWIQINYQIQIDKRLEDIAANNFSGKFDSPKSETKTYHSSGKILKDIQIQS
jgi:predicted RNA-binding protein with TRAM domain